MTIPDRVQLILLSFLVLLVAACAPDTREETPRSTALELDSAGIIIVESSTPMWTPQTNWRVAEPPIFDVGGTAGDSVQQFSAIRGVHRRADSSVVILDGASASFRFFDGRGNPIGRAGRAGTGPGEFPATHTGTLHTCGTDSMYVEIPVKGISVFTANGEFVRQFQLNAKSGRFPDMLGCRDNSLIAWMQFGPPVTSEGVHRIRGILAQFDLNGSQIAVIDTVPIEDHSYRRGAEGYGYSPTPYGRKLSFAIGHSGFAAGIGDAFEIPLWNSTGRLYRIARVPGPDRPMTAAEIQRFREFLLPKMGAGRGGMDAALTAERMPRTIPAYAELRFDAMGFLWVREYDFADATHWWDALYANLRNRKGQREVVVPDRRWRVLDPVGQLQGEVQLPAHFDVREIGTDWVLGIWRDDLDVEHVRIYKLDRR